MHLVYMNFIESIFPEQIEVLKFILFIKKRFKVISEEFIKGLRVIIVPIVVKK